MNEKKYAKDLIPGDWIVTEFGVNVVRATHNYENGWWSIDLSDGQMIDCLAFRSFVLS